ncbi:MAG TPA: DNA-binding response regulator, partial [Chitinophagaceae bacterium]|nr:DNA-binding response regulator [Chitinophagaceae bacterium]
MLKCVAIDDEPLALEIIRNYVGKLNDIDIVATFTDTVSAKAFLDDNNVDLLFLDIQMPDINGMRFYAQLAQKPPVIFTT